MDWGPGPGAQYWPYRTKSEFKHITDICVQFQLFAVRTFLCDARAPSCVVDVRHMSTATSPGKVAYI